MTTIEQLGGLTSQYNEIIKRVVNGSLSPILVKRALQGIIEGAMWDPSVVDEVERQLGVWKSLGVVITDNRWQSILEQAKHFVPDTDSDVPLVTGGFGYDALSVVIEKLVSALTPPNGYTKHNYISGAELRFVQGMEPAGCLRLVHYDPNTYAGLSPAAAIAAANIDGARLAGLEVLEYLVLTPESGLGWDGKGFFRPNLSGLEQKHEGAWSHVPFLDNRDGSNRGFKVGSYLAGHRDIGFSSPAVRECS